MATLVAKPIFVSKIKPYRHQAGVELGHYSRTAAIGVNLEMGRSFELKANLNPKNTASNGPLEPIEFTVGNIDKWTEGSANVNMK